MKRYRIGLIHQFAKSNSVRVDGLRSVLGGFGVGRVPPHITLVAPTNIHQRDAESEIYRLRVIASQTGPYDLVVGPAGTFYPVSPVLYLSVGGEGIGQLAALQGRLSSSKLYKVTSRPFVPHVTILEPAQPTDIDAALHVIRAPLFKHQATAFEMMVNPAQGYWEVSGDFRFAPLRRFSRGGMSLEVFTHCGGDLSVYSFVSHEGVAEGLFWPHADRRLRTDGQQSLGLSIYHEGELIACASSAFHSFVALIRAVVVRSDVRRMGIGSLALSELVYQLQLEHVEKIFVVSSEGHQRFFEACGARPESVPRWIIDYDSGMTLNSWSFSSL